VQGHMGIHMAYIDGHVAVAHAAFAGCECQDDENEECS
jgi:prepilin-type processing-associated H-X9-DG protein